MMNKHLEEEILTKKLLFQNEYKIRVYDLNYANHLGHDKFISLIHEARLSFLYAHQMSEMNIGGNEKVLLVKSVTAEYFKVCFYDDILIIKIFLFDIGKKSFTLGYLAERKSDNEKIACCLTTLITYDIALQQSIEIPEKLLNILK